ncbi:hypothetical protein ACTMTJ_26975 [Phytohabitans sp. LJ34]|uniref:hypothetical protein n=1 Tax=Phytohabitans sp. LJ34 TaxID=3452217 RepID=UPI003F891953
MGRRVLAVLALVVGLTLAGSSAAHAVETRVFRGEGTSSFGPGIAYYYALGDALGQAGDAGFESEQCHVVDSEDFWPMVVYVYLECTR